MRKERGAVSVCSHKTFPKIPSRIIQLFIDFPNQIDVDKSAGNQLSNCVLDEVCAISKSCKKEEGSVRVILHLIIPDRDYIRFFILY